MTAVSPRLAAYHAALDRAARAEFDRQRRRAERARRDAHRDIARDTARDIPNPEQFARHLPLRLVEALEGAWLGRTGWRVAGPYVPEMRRNGLVECGGPCLTAFGLAVRRALRSEDA